MKTLMFATSAIVALLTSVGIAANDSAIVVEEPNHRVRGRKLQSAAWHWGYDRAEARWNMGFWPCTMIDVLTGFWNHVNTAIYTDCENRYVLNAAFVDACKNGAETFVYEKTQYCTQTQDCVDIGERFAADVISEFCNLLKCSGGYCGISLFPDLCKDIAISTCQANFMTKLGDHINNNGQCGTGSNPLLSPWDLTPTQYNDLKQECEDEVTEFIEGAHLPGDNTPPLDATDTEPCSPNPCLNGGTCHASGTNFVCSCPSGYSGDLCQHGPGGGDPCSSSPCLNGGTCYASGTTFVCSCPSGYSGDLCQHGPTVGISWDKYSHSLCRIGPGYEEGVDFITYYGKTMNWCKNQCEGNSSCLAFDLRPRDNRCKQFLTYPPDERYKRDAVCWKKI